MLDTGPLTNLWWQHVKNLRQRAQKTYASCEADHPGRIALRAYGLTLALSLGPALVSFLIQNLRRSKRPAKKLDLGALVQLVGKKLSYDGFAFAITTAVAGGPWLKEVWRKLYESADGPSTNDNDEETAMNGNGPLAPTKHSPLSDVYWHLVALVKSVDPQSERALFLSNTLAALVGFLLLRSGREKALRRPISNSDSAGSATLDLTLLLLVRAVDGLLQTFLRNKVTPSTKVKEGTAHSDEAALIKGKSRADRYIEKLSVNIDAITFWICGSRIMWCWFYEPERLPPSYVKWISALANVEPRFLEALRRIRSGEWSYFTGSKEYSHLLESCAEDLGFPASWGSPVVLPAYGGKAADEVWKKLGVSSRPGVGGIPCDLVHGKVGKKWGLEGNCQVNMALRTAKTFTRALAIYLPVHFIPVLLAQPKSLLSLTRLLQVSLGALRSTSFLTSFLALNWYGVCLVRTVIIAKLFPGISHQFWDGPQGSILAGCLASGASIWVENGKRRGEMALYVLPKALRTCLPTNANGKWARVGRTIECAVFVLSLSALLQTAATQPTSLRGLSRWASRYILRGSESSRHANNASSMEEQA